MGIHKVEWPLKLHRNEWCILIDQKGWFGCVEVWYTAKGNANILFLKALKQCHHITYDSEDRDGVFKVYTKTDIVEFQPMRMDYITWT